MHRSLLSALVAAGRRGLRQPVVASGSASRCMSSRPPAMGGVSLPRNEALLTLRVILPKFGKVSPATPFMTVSRPGRMLLELTPADSSTAAGEKPRYDWSNKMGFSLNQFVLTAIAGSNFTGPVSFSQPYDDNGELKGKLTLTVTPKEAGAGQGSRTAFTMSVTATPDDGSAERAVSLALTTTELWWFKHLCTQSIVWASGWQYNLDPTLFTPEHHTVQPAAPRGGAASGAGGNLA